MDVQSVITHLEKIAPLSYQESYDNAGLITGDPSWEVKGVLTSLDATEAIVEEAIQRNCNLIVAHHPIVFKGLKKITGANYVERTIIKAIKSDIAIYAIHTNLDNVLYKGVNAKIAERLSLQDVEILAPKSMVNQEVGSGVWGHLPKPMPSIDFLAYLKSQMKVGIIRHTELIKKQIERVAICGGSGSFLLPFAKEKKADIYITADFKYHEFFDADKEIIIADIGHYESEQFTIDLLYEIISETFSTFAVYKTEVNTNPVKYY